MPGAAQSGAVGSLVVLAWIVFAYAAILLFTRQPVNLSLYHSTNIAIRCSLASLFRRDDRRAHPRRNCLCNLSKRT